MLEIQPKRPTVNGSAESFTGYVWFDVIAEGVSPSRLRVSIVRFSGGGEVVEVRPGDTIYTPPAEWHWHGAAPGHFMSHLSMSEDLGEGQEGPITAWGEHLTGEEYPGH
jgi:hypothetical protein